MCTRKVFRSQVTLLHGGEWISWSSNSVERRIGGQEPQNRFNVSAHLVDEAVASISVIKLLRKMHGYLDTPESCMIGLCVSVCTRLLMTRTGAIVLRVLSRIKQISATMCKRPLGDCHAFGPILSFPVNEASRVNSERSQGTSSRMWQNSRANDGYHVRTSDPGAAPITMQPARKFGKWQRQYW